MAAARSLAVQPAWLLADEPSGNLDSKSADAVFELPRSVNCAHGTAMPFVTHNAALAERRDRIDAGGGWAADCPRSGPSGQEQAR